MSEERLREAQGIYQHRIGEGSMSMSMSMSRIKRVLLAKPGLDGHDRGVRVVALALREAGMEVVYTGLHQSPEAIVRTAIQEDVDLVGLSILSGSHLGLARKVVDKLRQEGAFEKKVVVGGVIPPEDVDELKAIGVAEVFPSGSDIHWVVNRVSQIVGAAGRAGGEDR